MHAVMLLASVAVSASMPGDDYLFGRQQALRIVADRPMLAEYLVADDPLLSWTAAQFAGSRTQRRIHWDPQPPRDGIDASHQWGDTPSLRLHARHQTGPLRGQRKSFNDAWADVIFELHNLAQGPAFDAAWNAVTAHRMTAAQWLEAVTRAEHRALLYTREFHRTRWRAWMRSRDAAWNGLRWTQIAAVPTDYFEWIATYADPEGYPYRDYLPGYRGAMQQSALFGLPLRADPFSLDAVQTDPGAVQP